MTINLQKTPMVSTNSGMTEVPMDGQCPKTDAKPLCENSPHDCFAGVEVDSVTLSTAGALARGSVAVADKAACAVECAVAGGVEMGLEAVETVGGGMMEVGSNVLNGVWMGYEYVTSGIVSAWNWLTGR